MIPHRQFLAVSALIERIQRVCARWEPIFGKKNDDYMVNARIAEMVLEHYRPKPKTKRKRENHPNQKKI